MKKADLTRNACTGLPPYEQTTVLAGFLFNEWLLATLRGFGVELQAYVVRPLHLVYIPETTVLVSTKQEVSWIE